jgi:hypothetical protein
MSRGQAEQPIGGRLDLRQSRSDMPQNLDMSQADKLD